MSLPKVTILYANGGLLADIAALDGIGGIVGTGTSVGLLGIPKTVYNLDDAVTQGFTELAEPDMYRHLKEFYGEVGGNQELHIMIVPNTMTLAEMVTDTNANGAKKLLTAADGKIRLLAIYRKPAGGYDGGDDFIDEDVAAAILASKTFGDARLAQLAPIRILIEGRVMNPAAPNVLTPNTSGNPYTGVVLGGTKNDGSASVGLALGRAVKYAAHIKIGKVANGPLSITTCFVGNKEIKDVTNLATLHGNGFISFMKHPQKAGFFIGIDRMANNTDYRFLAYGRIVDKAAIIAAATYADEVENEVDLEPNGNLASYAVTALETKIEQQINVLMGSQISGVSIYINPAQPITTNSTVKMKVRVLPKGYSSFIEVEIGLTTAIA